jgi:hypothetical protein
LNGVWQIGLLRKRVYLRLFEDAAGFTLHLPEYDSYFTWSLLVALTLEGRVEALQPGKRNKRYRLV